MSENTQIIKEAYKLLKSCNEILLEEQKSGLKLENEMSELDRQYRRWLIEEAGRTADFTATNYRQ